MEKNYERKKREIYKVLNRYGKKSKGMLLLIEIILNNVLKKLGFFKSNYKFFEVKFFFFEKMFLKYF